MRDITLTQLFNRQSGICPYCGDDMTMELNSPKTATLDHIIPKSRGGKNSIFNLLACCFDCNHEKSNTDLATFLIIKRRFERASPGAA